MQILCKEPHLRLIAHSNTYASPHPLRLLPKINLFSKSLADTAMVSNQISIFTDGVPLY